MQSETNELIKELSRFLPPDCANLYEIPTETKKSGNINIINIIPVDTSCSFCLYGIKEGNLYKYKFFNSDVFELDNLKTGNVVDILNEFKEKLKTTIINLEDKVSRIEGYSSGEKTISESTIYIHLLRSEATRLNFHYFYNFLEYMGNYETSTLFLKKFKDAIEVIPPKFYFSVIKNLNREAVLNYLKENLTPLMLEIFEFFSEEETNGLTFSYSTGEEIKNSIHAIHRVKKINHISIEDLHFFPSLQEVGQIYLSPEAAREYAKNANSSVLQNIIVKEIEIGFLELENANREFGHFLNSLVITNKGYIVGYQDRSDSSFIKSLTEFVDCANKESVLYKCFLDLGMIND